MNGLGLLGLAVAVYGLGWWRILAAGPGEESDDD